MSNKPHAAGTGYAPSYVIVLGLTAIVAGTVGIVWLIAGIESPRAVGMAMSEAHRATAKTGVAGIQWYDHHARFWQQLDYTPLNDRDALEKTIAGWVANRHPGADIDPAPLIRDLTDFLHAQAAPDAQRYLERIGHRRHLRDDLRDDHSVQAVFRRITGAEIAKGTSADEVLEQLWASTPEAAERPAAIATQAVMQVAPAGPLPEGGLPPGWQLFNATLPQFTVWDDLGEAEMDRWMGPFAEGFAAVTAATTPYEAVYEANDGALICVVHTAVRTTEGVAFILALNLYYAPAEEAWHVEWFVNYYPYAVSWPF